MSTAELIERRVRERLHPTHFELFDDSARHVGHPGATSGGGHYRLVVVARTFTGRSLLERHRMVHEAVADLFGDRIHALSMKTLTPDEWDEAS